MNELQCLLIDNNLDIIKTIYKINHYDYSNKDIIYDITLTNIDITDGLLDENFKFELYKNNTKISEGNFSNLQVEKSNGTLKYYQRAIDTWSKLDILKYETAKKNKLNYLIFYSLEELKQWLQ